MPDRQRLLELALKGLEAERAKINDEIAQIKSELARQPIVAKGAELRNELTTTQHKKKRTMSAASRKKISEAMKRRYAEAKKAAKKSS